MRETVGCGDQGLEKGPALWTVLREAPHPPAFLPPSTEKDNISSKLWGHYMRNSFRSN